MLLTPCLFFKSLYQPTNALNKYNKMQIIIYNTWQVSNAYMFPHRCAILRESTRTKEYQSNTPSTWIGVPKYVGVW